MVFSLKAGILCDAEGGFTAIGRTLPSLGFKDAVIGRVDDTIVKMIMVLRHICGSGRAGIFSLPGHEAFQIVFWAQSHYPHIHGYAEGNHLNQALDQE